jgi:MerR family transcriptional regulator, mercuric resistance operon regulatory protein
MRVGYRPATDAASSSPSFPASLRACGQSGLKGSRGAVIQCSPDIAGCDGLLPKHRRWSEPPSLHRPSATILAGAVGHRRHQRFIACLRLRGETSLKSLSDISIGELSRQSDCAIETIRYYERIGLLPKPRRESGRFRRYGAEDIRRLRFIRRARQLGFSLKDVRQLLRLAPGPREAVCAEARQIAAAHVAEVRAKIADLRVLERILAGAICACHAAQGPACPIIEAIRSDPSPSDPESASHHHR